MRIIYNIVLGDFFQSLLRIRRRRRHYHHSSGTSGSMSIAELLVFIAGAVLIYIVLKTNFIEKITKNELVRTIIKVVVTLVGVGLAIFSFTIN